MRRRQASRATSWSASSRRGGSAVRSTAEDVRRRSRLPERSPMVPGFIRRGGETDFTLSRPRLNIVAIVIALGFTAAGAAASVTMDTPVPVVVLALAGLVLMQSPKVAKQWERGVVLR